MNLIHFNSPVFHTKLISPDATIGLKDEKRKLKVESGMGWKNNACIFILRCISI